jgi:hypothetical protein
LPIGYRDHAEWRDMSEYVVHFTRDIPGKTAAYDSQLSILYNREVRAVSSFGAARRFEGLAETQRCACFSEVPLDRLDRLVERRSQYGVGFSQDVLIKAGGGRVWYLDNDGGVAASFREVMAKYVTSPLDVTSPFWRLAPFVDFPGTYGSTEYRFE